MTASEKIEYRLAGNPLSYDNYARHLFTLWISGAYGQELANKQKAIVSRDFDNDRAMRRFVINEFCDMLASECDCSAAYAQRIVAKTYDKETLAALTKDLIAEVRDHYTD